MKRISMFALAVGLLLTLLAAPVCAEVVSIGFTGPLSGGAAKYGKNNLEGLEHAIAEINDAGGITVNGKQYTFKLTALDDMYKPAESVSNARRMMTTVSPKPIAVFCPHSGGILAMAKFSETEGFLMHGYTDNVAVLKQGNQLLVKGPMSMTFYNSGPVEIGWKRGYRKAALLCGAHEAGKIAETIFQAQWKEKGGQILSVASIDFKSVTDFYPYLTKALADKPDCLYLYGPSESSAMIVNQARELGFKGGFLLGSQCKLDEMAKVASMDALNNSAGVAPAAFYPLPLMQEYAKRHKARYGADAIPTAESSYNYEVMYIFAEAMKKAGTVSDPHKIRKAIPEVVPVGDHSVRGIKKITPEGQFISGYYAMEVLNGKFSDPIEIDPIPWYEKYGATYMPE